VHGRLGAQQECVGRFELWLCFSVAAYAPPHSRAADSAKQFLLGAKELREVRPLWKLPAFLTLPPFLTRAPLQLRTWSAGVTAGPFNTAVQFFFRRHLERAAAQKHGAAGGLAAVLRKRADELAAKDAASKIELVRP